MTSKIEWLAYRGVPESWNPVFGCTPVSIGCDNCYAARQAWRLWNNFSLARYRDVVTREGWTGKLRYSLVEELERPLRWRKPRTVFVCSMSDLFHPKVPDEFILEMFLVMAMCPHHTFIVLTKRPARMAEISRAKPWFAKAVCKVNDKPFCCSRSVLPNVWMGTTIENRVVANPRLKALRQVKAAIRFVSFEPLLEEFPPSDVPSWIDWAIIGAESGPGARPCRAVWIRSLIGRLAGNRIPTFVKQLGRALAREIAPGDKTARGHDIDKWPKWLRRREWPE